MSKKNAVLLLPFVLLFTFCVKADVPPDAGMVRVSMNLITETGDDLSDHRFFLDFYGDLKEVEIKNKGRTSIAPMGGGARYGSGTLLAIPKKSLSGFEGVMSADQLKELSGAINKKEITGVVELASHRFSADVPAGQKPAEVHYLLVRDGDSLKAEKITEEKPKSNESAQSAFSTSRTGLVVGGVLLSLAVLFAGIFAFRKVSKKG